MRISDWSSDVCSSDLPGHTDDSMALMTEDRLFTGDTLLIGGTGRTDLPTGDPEALHDSLFNIILRLDPALKIFPAHDYQGRSWSTIGRELADNPRLRHRDQDAFVAMMQNGRASCRERVCTYVLISVVAVSLKKKHETKHN